MSITTEPATEVSTVDREAEKARRFADQLRSLAGMVERHPELLDALDYPFYRMNVPTGSKVRETLAAFARAGARAGAEVIKGYSPGNDHDYAHVDVRFGPDVMLHVYGDRAKVCERVQTGTETVVKQVPDPVVMQDVPLVEVVEEVPVYEWRCVDSLLKEAGAS